MRTIVSLLAFTFASACAFAQPRLVVDLTPENPTRAYRITRSSGFDGGLLLFDWSLNNTAMGISFIPSDSNEYDLILERPGRPIGIVNDAQILQAGITIYASPGTPLDSEPLTQDPPILFDETIRPVSDGGLLYFAVDSGVGPRELMETDGTEPGTRLVSSRLANAQNQLLYVHQYMGKLGSQSCWEVTTPDGKELMLSSGEPPLTSTSLSFPSGVGEWAGVSFVSTDTKLFFQLSGAILTRGSWVAQLGGGDPVKFQSEAVPEGYPMYAIGDRAYYVIRDAGGDYILNSHTGETGGLKSLYHYKATEPEYWVQDDKLYFLTDESIVMHFDAINLVSEPLFAADTQPFANIQSVVQDGGSVYIIARGEDVVDRLWITDGTESGTVQCTGLSEVPDEDMIISGASNGIAYIELDGTLYRIDSATPSSAALVEFNKVPISTHPTDFSEYDNRLVFSTSEIIDPYWYISDGTAPGTTPLIDEIDGLPLGEDVFVYNVSDSVAYMYNNSRNEYWSSELGSSDSNRVLVKENFDFLKFVRLNDDSYYVQTDLESDEHELRKVTDGGAGSEVVYSWPDLFLSKPVLYSSEGSLWALEREFTSVSVWHSDGTTTGTSELPVRFVNPRGGYDEFLTSWKGNLIICLALERDREQTVYISDGTPGNTIRLTPDTAADKLSVSQHILTAEDLFYFGTHDPQTGESRFYTSDGTAEGTHSFLMPPLGELPNPVARYQNRILLRAGPSEQRQLWLTDGTTEGTRLLDPDWADIVTSHEEIGSISFLSKPALSIPEKRTILSAQAQEGFGSELHTGWPGTLQLVAEIDPGNYSSFPAELTRIGDQIFFSAETFRGGRELYVLDVDSLPDAPLPDSFMLR